MRSPAKGGNRCSLADLADICGIIHLQRMVSLASKIVDHYQRHAYAWDSDRRSSGWNDKIWHDRFIDALPAHASVLDLGCGGGAPVAMNLVAHELRVTGIDTSPAMISLCRSRLPEQEWIVADMRSLSLGRRFDGLLAWDSFFHLSPDDQRAMFIVFAAHAAPAATLMFNTGPSYGEGIGSYRGDPLYHASLDEAEYKELLARFGFSLIHHKAEDPKAGGRTVSLVRAALES
jgi:SAM-dependent methyltransferase